MALFDAFLELKGIDGESTDAKMSGKIELDSFSWSATRWARSTTAAAAAPARSSTAT